MAKVRSIVYLISVPDRAEIDAWDKLTELLKNPHPVDVQWLWSVGRAILTLSGPGRCRYGEGFLAKIAELQGQPDLRGASSQLFIARQFARTYTYPEIRSFAAAIEKHPHLCCRHVRHLVKVADKRERRMWLDRCIKERLSSGELNAQLQELRGDRRSAGGIKPRPRNKSTVAIGLRELARLCRRWNLNAEIWLDQGELTISGRPDDAQRQALQRELPRTLDEFAKVERTIKELADRLQDLSQLLNNDQPKKRKSAGG